MAVVDPSLTAGTVSGPRPPTLRGIHLPDEYLIREYAFVGRQALASVPQLAGDLPPLGSKSAENLHSVCDMCIANLGQLDDAAAGAEVASGLTGRRRF